MQAKNSSRPPVLSVTNSRSAAVHSIPKHFGNEGVVLEIKLDDSMRVELKGAQKVSIRGQTEISMICNP